MPKLTRLPSTPLTFLSIYEDDEFMKMIVSTNIKNLKITGPIP